MLILIAVKGVDVPGIRELVGFIYLTFIPGLLILRILRIRNLGYVETLLYSVGLSITFVMFLGFFMNAVFSYLGVLRPISILPLTIMSTLLYASFVLSPISGRDGRLFFKPNKVRYTGRRYFPRQSCFYHYCTFLCPGQDDYFPLAVQTDTCEVFSCSNQSRISKAFSYSGINPPFFVLFVNYLYLHRRPCHIYGFKF